MKEFSKRSKRAILVFCGIFLVLVLLPRLYFYIYPTPKFTLKTVDIGGNDTLIKSINTSELLTYNERKKASSRFKKPKKKFDPNGYSVEDWMKLGLSEKQAAAILKFNKYGFHSPSDLRKCFVFQNDEFYDLIVDSLVFPEQKSKFTHDPNRLDLNFVRKNDLTEVLHGDSLLAKRILSYKFLLGGFYEMEQLQEVHGMTQKAYEELRKNFYVNRRDIRKLKINTEDVYRLKEHPYIHEWKVAAEIVQSRKKEGDFKSLDDLKKRIPHNESIFNKLAPYLKF